MRKWWTGEPQITHASPITAKAAKRMERLPERDVLDWCDQAGSGIARALSEYRRTGDQDSLTEAYEGVEALLGCLQSIPQAGLTNS